MWFSKVGRINLRWSVNCVTFISLFRLNLRILADSDRFFVDGDDLTGLDPVLKPVEAKRHIVKFNRVCPAQLQKARWTRSEQSEQSEHRKCERFCQSVKFLTPKKMQQVWLNSPCFFSHYLEHEREREIVKLLTCCQSKTSVKDQKQVLFRRQKQAEETQQRLTLHNSHTGFLPVCIDFIVSPMVYFYNVLAGISRI
jgi:hypothetical protein